MAQRARPFTPPRVWGGIFSSLLFAVEGILIEPDLWARCNESAIYRGMDSELTFGTDVANRDKTEDECRRDSAKFAIGCMLNTRDWAISIPE